MTPTHVEVLQCGGACHRSSQGCVATKTREKEVWVMVGRCGITTGKCQKECARLTVVEHLECGCDCREEEREACPRESHRYNRDSCQCQCRDTRAKEQCLDQVKTGLRALSLSFIIIISHLRASPGLSPPASASVASPAPAQWVWSSLT